MTADFEQKLLETIERQKLLTGGAKTLAAVSGGADSVAMVCALAKLRQKLGVEVVIGHINHQLRGEDSRQDEVFVRDLAGRLGIESHFATVAVAAEAKRLGQSIETAGRQIRLPALAEMAKRSGCRYVATGHQMDDQAETILFRLMRGTGFRGLGGIRPKRELHGVMFVRPMLEIRRAQIQQYCRQLGQAWRQDKSNADVQFRRNWIRHKLLDFLQSQTSADIVGLLAALADGCMKLQDRIEYQCRQLWRQAVVEDYGGQVVLSLEPLGRATEPVIVEIVQKAAQQAGCGLRYVHRGHYQRIIELLRNGRGRVCLPGRFEAAAQTDRIVFAAARQRKSDSLPQPQIALELEKEIIFGPWRIVGRLLKQGQWDLERFAACKDGLVEWFDADRVFGPVVVRNRRKGDRFWPIGMPGEKKVGKFLTDARPGPEIKDRVCIVADADKILWVCPVRCSRQARIRECTKRVLEIRIFPV